MTSRARCWTACAGNAFEGEEIDGALFLRVAGDEIPPIQGGQIREFVSFCDRKA